LPDSAEQQAIADFLDRKTAKIDDLVAEQERLIALIEEKRLAVISHAVTKGLDPRSPMKDSGVEWMGRVPQAWAETALKRVAIAMCDGPFGSGLKSDHYVASGVRVVRLQNIKVNEFAASDAAYVDEEYFRTELGRHEVTAGDLLVAGLGDDRHAVGRACVAPPEIGPAMVKADCFRFRLDRAVALPRFVAMQLSAGAEFDAGRMSTGSTRSRIPLSVMGTRPLLLPSVPEQQAIMAFLDGDETRFNAMKAEATRNIGFLKERRSALISAAVTGKIDVHSIAPPEMDAAA
jgi:type I restriction enzyme S subunit